MYDGGLLMPGCVRWGFIDAWVYEGGGGGLLMPGCVRGGYYCLHGCVLGEGGL